MKTEELFGTDGVSGTLGAELTKIKAELDTTGNNKLGKLITDAIKTKPTQPLNFSASYTTFKKAVDDSVKIIDEALESNDLTELDTTNLKSLKNCLNETLTTFDNAVKDAGLDSSKENEVAKLTDEALGKLKAGLDSAIELGNTATEKATATHAFSQQQPETIADMQESLKQY